MSFIKKSRKSYVDSFEYKLTMRLPVDSLFYPYVCRRHPIIAMKLAVPKFFKSLKGWNRNHLGSYVIYEGKRYWINNMNGCYRLRPVTNCDHNPEDDLRVPLDDEGVKPEMTFKNCKDNALHMYKFWCRNWASIDVHKALEPDKYKGSDGILGKGWFDRWV